MRIGTAQWSNGLKALGLINWRRWVATFCVALVALVMIGRVSAADRDCSVQWPVAYVATPVDSGNTQGKQPVTAAHHCCSVHIADLAQLLPGAGLPALASAEAKLPMPDGKSPRERPSGFDRPPRVSADA